MSPISFVSISIRAELVFPEQAVCVRPGRVFAATMLMPEAAVHENGSTVLWKNNVRCAREVFLMETIAKAVRVQKPPYRHFRRSVLRFDASHHPAARRTINDVGHPQFFIA